MLARLISTGFYGGDLRAPELWFEFLFEVSLPIAGIVLELVDWPLARWVNVGTFAVPGCLWLAEAIWWHSDPFFGVLLIIAFGLLTTAGVTEIVYRRTRTESSHRSDS
jgi:predicted membrane channel-forming protein YqfA (hemolysin III family)